MADIHQPQTAPTNSSSFGATTAALNPFYQTISTAGFVPLLVVVTGIRSLIALASIVLNLLLVWVTVRERKLHGTCNLLIALESASLVVYQLGIFPIFGVVLSGRNLIPLGSCLPIQALPLFGKYLAMATMSAIGLDRLKCVLLPFWPQERHERLYLWLLIIICISAPAYIVGLSLTVAMEFASSPVMCSTSEISPKIAGDMTNCIGMGLNLLSPAIYCLLGLLLFLRSRRARIVANQQGRMMSIQSQAAAANNISRRSQQQQQQNDNNNNGSSSSNSGNISSVSRIYKSLAVILLVQLLGWGTNWVAVALFTRFFDSSQFALDAYQKWAVNAVFGYVICVATAANAPALYFCSSEYREAFRKHIFGSLGFAAAGGAASNGGGPSISTTINTIRIPHQQQHQPRLFIAV